MAYCYSSSTAPTVFYNTKWAFWYDTANNLMKKTADAGVTWETGCSLPICIVTETTTAYTSIDQVFNGFGYIGSTVFALPGVKGLIPDGRNADGTLKNEEFTVGKVRTYTNASTRNNAYLALSANDNDLVGRVNDFIITDDISQSDTSRVVYSPTLNKNIISGGTEWKWAIVGQWSTTSSSPFSVTSFQPKLPFHAVDRNDSSWIAQQAMPSGKYIDLSLGASGATYTAPANGWVIFRRTSNASGQFLQLVNESSGKLQHFIYSSAANQILGASIPVKKGDLVVIGYTVASTTNQIFRFIYAEGE
jgi:hypothetical protein